MESGTTLETSNHAFFIVSGDLFIKQRENKQGEREREGGRSGVVRNLGKKEEEERPRVLVSENE